MMPQRLPAVRAVYDTQSHRVAWYQVEGMGPWTGNAEPRQLLTCCVTATENGDRRTARMAAAVLGHVIGSMPMWQYLVWSRRLRWIERRARAIAGAS
jgi:hypothetical protein